MKKEIITVVSATLGIIAGALSTNYLKNQLINRQDKKIQKFKGYYSVLNHWLMIKEQGDTLSAYFSYYNFKSIAIYGMGELGNRLLEELKDTGVEVKYAIDNNMQKAFGELPIYSIDDDLEEVDVIVVTPMFESKEIIEVLSKRTNYKIVTIEDVVYES